MSLCLESFITRRQRWLGRKAGLDIPRLPTGPKALPLLTDAWSHKWTECKKCGTTEIPHKGYGYCEKCRVAPHHRKRLSHAFEAGLMVGDTVEILGDPFGFHGTLTRDKAQIVDDEVMVFVKVPNGKVATVPLSKLSLRVGEGW